MVLIASHSVISHMTHDLFIKEFLPCKTVDTINFESLHMENINNFFFMYLHKVKHIFKGDITIKRQLPSINMTIFYTYLGLTTISGIIALKHVLGQLHNWHM